MGVLCRPSAGGVSGVLLGYWIGLRSVWLGGYAGNLVVDPSQKPCSRIDNRHPCWNIDMSNGPLVCVALWHGLGGEGQKTQWVAAQKNALPGTFSLLLITAPRGT